MKAIRVFEKNDIRMVDVEKPTINSDDDVLIKVRAFGICGSDVAIYKGNNPFVTYPRIIGHEVAGEVHEIGKNVKDLSLGDRVVLEPIEYCGECYACRHGRHNVCEELKVYGVHIDGGFCEYMVVDKSKLHKVDSSIPFESAVVAEPFTIAEECTDRAQLLEDDLVLVTGAGPIGLLVINIAKDKGAKVIVSETNKYRLEIAKEFGADYLVDPNNDNLSDRIKEISSEGANVYIDTTGINSVIREGLRNLSAASRFVPLAFGNEDIAINYASLNKKEMDILGSRLQNNKFPKVVSYIKEKRNLIDKFVTHVYKAEDYQKAFDEFSSNDTKAIKIVLTFN
ncbi:zinc-binding alcohol dehydrogenase family protein [Anaerococcus murdochii]|uniref:Zinc-binding alcohol dehydrogenase family protein n=1 Tax=Anaerococcus murdochii TaxID=411577 RepID=A0ABS7SXC0_9FIRM|nr:zinc-binding alcohol dehydrogenase family protein [Anaerococcus murdochii]MBZ2386167.1 zinc-binding alcohol dehydrogenase family protein [Anaerococcus murdochii]